MTKPRVLVLLRHGQSEWNRRHRLTGWADVDLSPKGVAQSREAARSLQRSGVEFDEAYTSDLRRARRSLEFVLQEMGIDIPTHHCWELNERHYGALEGMGSILASLRFGPRKVIGCQRNYHSLPPLLAPTDPRYPGNQARYANVPADCLPRGESMADAATRMRRVWLDRIAPALRAGRSILVVGHKNILRAMVREVAQVPGEAVQRLAIRTGEPWIFELDADLRIVNHEIIQRR